VVDFYDRKNKVIHEIKKSGKIEQAHIWQLKYYIYLFDKEGITDVTGLLEYPALRQTTQVVIEDGDFQKIETILSDIELLIHKEECPPVITSKICRSCSYFDFCYVNEKDIDEIINSTPE
jgi:CRISPR-associated exonuclease Cas4